MQVMYLKPRCGHCNKRMSYHLHYLMILDELWEEACKRLKVATHKLMCRPCMEKGIGRPIRQSDLTNCMVNDGCFGFDRNKLEP